MKNPYLLALRWLATVLLSLAVVSWLATFGFSGGGNAEGYAASSVLAATLAPAGFAALLLWLVGAAVSWRSE